MKYADEQGRETPPDGWYGPGHVYLGSLNRGRVATLPGSGRKLKVHSQNEGSTTVRVSNPGRTFTTKDHAEVTIKESTGLTTMSRGTVVMTRTGGAS